MKQPLILKHADVLPAILPPLLDWYKHHAADRQLPWRENPAPYHVWVSEIMLQQTRASAVIPYYERFLSALPDIAALAHADDEMLMKLWQGLGYYSRARNLKKAAQKVLAEYDGELPQDYKALLALPGIGRYTAGAIGSIAWGRPWPAIDGNVLRVTFRVMACREDILAARTRTALEKALSPLYPAGRDAADLNQAFMDLGASVCLPNGKPHCSRCPLSRLCLAHAEGREQDFPVKAAAKVRRIEEKTILLLKQGSAYAIRQRPKQGLLAGLWEFPNLPGRLTAKEVRTYLQARGLAVQKIRPLPPARHVFTHVEWHLSGWEVLLEEDAVRVGETPDFLHWVTLPELVSKYSIPAAFSYYFPHSGTI